MMAPMPATDPRSASRTPASVPASWLISNRMAVGIMIQVTNRRNWSMPLRSSEETSENRRASDDSWLAYESPPTLVAR